MSYGNRSRYDRGSYGRSSGYGSPSMNQGSKPVEIGKEYDVEVTELSRRGDGVAKLQGFVVFVRGAKVGEKVRIKVETVGPRFATAMVQGPSAVKSNEMGAPSSSSSNSSIAESV